MKIFEGFYKRAVVAPPGSECWICGKVFEPGEIVYRNYGSFYCGNFYGHTPGIRSGMPAVLKAAAKSSRRLPLEEVVKAARQPIVNPSPGVYSEPHKVSEPCPRLIHASDIDGFVDPLEKFKNEMHKTLKK